MGRKHDERMRLKGVWKDPEPPKAKAKPVVVKKKVKKKTKKKATMPGF